MTNILLCTLGVSWAVIPEAYAFLAPDALPLYQNHPEQLQLLALRDQYQLQPPDEIWVCTTQGTQNSLENLIHWVSLLQEPPLLRIWQIGRTELSTQEECQQIRELIVRACLSAHDYSNGGQVVLSLAGGRKTMSADLQWAGGLFGCQALLHIISAEPPLPKDFLQALPAIFTKPLSASWAKIITPLVVGQTNRSDLLDIQTKTNPPIKAGDYPLELPKPNAPLCFDTNTHALSHELNEREKESSHLFGNFLQTISRDENHENWRSLYRLPPRRIEQLRNTLLTVAHRDWLVTLPKADLHRHLGGCLTIESQRRVADAVWQTLTMAERDHALVHCKTLLDQAHWPWSWPKYLAADSTRAHNTAALLLHASSEQLQQNLWQVTEPRSALKDHHPAGFAAYERPGELSGSALLSHPAAILPYAEAVIQQAAAEGLAYVELRGSPQKYARHGLDFLTHFHRALTSLPNPTKIQFRFIVIADRRAEDAELQKTIDMAVQAKHTLQDFVVGLDMAGDESCAKPEKISHLFTPAFEACLPITIHAGEGEAAESIWQAAYHLHADRIGHGLTLNDNPSLAQRFRDRNICLELCPSSNREVVGFFDVNYPETRDMPRYPLLALWKQGLPLTLCTDNPGISQTSLADEYLAAARMVSGLSQWDVLAMIKQGFVHAFISGQEKEALLKDMDARLYDLLICG